MRSFLHKQQLVDSTFFDELDSESEALAVRLRDGVRALADPTIDVMFDFAYSEPHALVTEEREQFASYIAGFDEEQ